MLARRYRIVGFLGRGAVGEVYEAFDEELGEVVAVKRLRPEIAGDELALQRFKREIALAHRVTHPNVCRTYDLVRHQGEPGAEPPDEDCCFLTMERLRGMTLAEWLAERGRLSTAEALPIVLQIARALAAAHASGVIHRDLKSGNVFLDTARGLQAVVTDFGLAGSLQEERGAAALTATGELIGSPAYMAPEQVRGEAATPATDLYALGVVMYEMVTGELPFLGPTAFFTALKRLQEDPAPPRQRVPGLDRAWDDTIRRCLAREPKRRFQHAKDVVRALGSAWGIEDDTAPVPLPRRRRLSRWRAPAAALLVAALLLVQRPAGPPPLETAASSPSASRPRVAVLGFADLSGRPETAYLGNALFQMLPTELGAGGRLQLIFPDEVSRARGDLGLQPTTNLPAEALDLLRRRLHADYVIAGSYRVETEGRRAHCEASIQDARTGETVARLEVDGFTEDFLATPSALGEGLRLRLDARPLSAAEAAATKRARPASPEAALAYAEGLTALERAEGAVAGELFARAIAAEPDNPRFHAALARAWTLQGYEAKALEEARLAHAQAAPLRLEERRRIEAQLHEASGERDQAVAIYRELAEYFPDNPEYALLLAGAQTAAGEAQAALATLAAHQNLPGAVDDPRFDRAQAEAAISRADFDAALAATGRMEEKARRIGARSLVADAALTQSRIALARNERARALAQASRAEALYRALGDRTGLARALNLRGLLLDPDPARQAAAYREALALLVSIGNRRGASGVELNLGGVAFRKERLGEARQLFESALAGFSATGQKSNAAAALINLAAIADLESDLAGYRSRLEQALAVYRELGDAKGEAVARLNLGKAHFHAGDLTGAAPQVEAALSLSRALQDRRGEAQALGDRGAAHLRRGDSTAAERDFTAALSLFAAAGDKAGVADCELDLANVAMDREHWLEAEKRLGRAGAWFQESGQAGRVAEVDAFRARLECARRQPGPARQALARALEAASRNTNRRSSLALDLTEARVETAAGEPVKAIGILERALAQPSISAAVPQELEIRLALGEARLQAGRGEEGRRGLRELEHRARALGFGRIATRAAALLAPGGR